MVYGRDYALRCLRDFNAERAAELAAERYDAILTALAAGCSRREIADALGISRQALARFIERRQT